MEIIFAIRATKHQIPEPIILSIIQRTKTCIKCHLWDWGSNKCQRCGLCGNCDDSSLKFTPGMCTSCSENEWMRRQMRSGYWQ